MRIISVIALCLLVQPIAGCLAPKGESQELCRYCEKGNAIRCGFLEREGCSLYYELEGEGPALMLIHGSVNHALFHPVLSRLNDAFTVVYYDQRGLGLSKVEGAYEYDLANDVEDLEALRSELKLETMALLGASNGGPIAIDYALKYPERVSKIIFLDTYADNGDRIVMAWPLVKKLVHDETRAKKLKEIEENSSLSGREKSIREWLLLPHPHHHSPLPREYVELWHDCNVFSDLGRAPERDYSRLGALKEIKAPALVICGRHDAITPLAHSRKMADLLPNGRLVVFEKSGHLAFVEEEDGFIEAVRNFLFED